MFKKKKQFPASRPKKDTIVIIGNGFDIWQGLNTNYSQFQKYYLEHRDEILKKLHIKKRVYTDQDGNKTEISDVELIYGDPFQPEELDDDFWSTFEASLDNLDAERLNLFFGKERCGLREMKKSIRNASRILKEAFSGWIATIHIEAGDSGYTFGDNCVFINFNYTDTLVKRFPVNESDEFHIHGEASDKESIIFGHSSHPQEPEYMLNRLGGRFRGLFYVDNILYRTDKHVYDNIQYLCMFFAGHALMHEEVKDVYVLGHSLGPADLGYFDFLIRSTQVYKEDQEEKSELEDLNSVEDLHNRIQYVINSVGYGDGELEPEYVDAVQRRFAAEQDARNRQLQAAFLKKLGRFSDEELEQAREKIVRRTEDAMWHISYYSDRDKIWIEKVMRELGCTSYRLYPSIDEMLKRKNE